MMIAFQRLGFKRMTWSFPAQTTTIQHDNVRNASIFVSRIASSRAGNSVLHARKSHYDLFI
jgi:hypothetical protein